ncbi:NUDIX domain-containing protein [Actinoallomurus liliacearum]|uniref:NUDIX domain-containing protein n=1 Tax=Actinoallomurus liliacearum TaxID=1080073 RepID=UPI0031E5C93F
MSAGSRRTLAAHCHPARYPGRLSLLLTNVRGMTPDAAAKYFWHEAPVAEGLEITQVYGYLICPRTGRVLIQDDEGKFNLPGGTPESFDADLVDTLVREAFEENQVVVSDAVYLGYQEVHRPRREPYAQVRMVGLIGAFEQRQPDPDNGRTYRRLMTSLAEAPKVLGWGEPAVAQVKLAARIAEEAWGVPVGSPEPTGYVD